LGLGILLSTFIFMLVSNIPSSSMLYDYGWRIAFMFGAALSIIIYFLRKNLYETSDFMALIQQPMNLKAKKHFISSIAIGVLLVAPAAILTTQLFLFLPSYASTYLGMSKNILSDHIFYGSCIMILGCLFGGLVSDRVNKKILFCFLLLLICLLSYIFYNQLTDGHLNTLLLMLIFAFFGMLASTYTVIIAEISQANFRCRSIGLSYNLSYSIFSAPIPALSVLILDSTNLIMLPFWLIALSSIIGIIGTVATLSIWKNINQHQTLTCNQTI
ncbi:MFS transporter, partial [Cysteiniphilum litorale]